MLPLLAASSLAVGGYYAYQWSKKKPVDDAGFEIIELSPGDMSMQEFPGISTVTFYDKTLPLEYLRNRVREIVLANPWLAARLVARNNTVRAQYRKDQPDGYFFVGKADVHSSTDFKQSSQILRDYIVKKGKECVDTNEPLFRVSAIDCGSQHCLVVSLSHTLADGYTYYRIYSMLEAQIFEMNPIRVKTFEKDLADFLGKDIMQFMTSLPFILGMASNLFRQSVPSAVIDVDPKKIDQKKKDTKQAFLSTNDIITSWAFRYSECEYGMMAMNLRNRLKSITDTDAGNYEGSLLFYKDYDPDTIRSALNSLKSPSIPTFWNAIGGNNCIVSNWASFHHELVLPGGLQPIEHHPLTRDEVKLVRCTAIIYKRTKGQIAVLVNNTMPQNLTKDAISRE